MADKKVSVAIEGRYVVTSTGIEETKRKAQELSATQAELSDSAAAVGEAWQESMLDVAEAVKGAAEATRDAARSVRQEASQPPAPPPPSAPASAPAGGEDPRQQASRVTQQPPPETSALISREQALARARGMADTLQANLAGGVTTLGEQAAQEQRLARARYYVEQAASAKGPEGDARLSGLAQHLASLEEALKANREAIEADIAAQEQAKKDAQAQAEADKQERAAAREAEKQAQAAQRAAEREAKEQARQAAREEREAKKEQERQEKERARLERAAARAHGAPGDEPGLSGAMLEELRRLGGGGLASLGGLGRVLTRLGPYALAVGAPIAAFNAATGLLTGANQEGRANALALADLAKQYDHSLDPMGFFRQHPDFMPVEWLTRFNYTTEDAARVAANYDLPGGFQGDTKSILTLSRTSGLNEDAVTHVMRSLGLAGTFERGYGSEATRVLKLAMTEGVRDGVAQSDTIRALVGTIENAYRSGQQVGGGALSFNAALQSVLAGTGNRALQGQQGQQAQGDYLSAIAGGGDQALEVALFSAMGGRAPSAAQLGYTGDAARGYAAVAARSPMQAWLQYALPRLRAGNVEDPQLLADLEGAFLSLAGGDPALLGFMLGDMSPELALTAIARGDLVSEASALTPTFRAGMDPELSAQGGNALEQRTLGIQTFEAQTKLDNSLASLLTTGNLEEILRGWRQAPGLFARGLMNLANGGAGNTGLTGDLRRPHGLTAEEFERFITDPQLLDAASGARLGGGQDPQQQALDSLWLLGASAVTDTPGRQRSAAEITAGMRAVHHGLDLRIGEQGVADEVTNPFPGAEVVSVGRDDAFGGYLVLRDQQGNEWKFAHLEDMPEFTVGDRLDLGRGLGLEADPAGEYGGVSSGYHLHLQLADSADPRNRDYAAFMEAFLQGAQDPSLRNSGSQHQLNVNIRVDGLSSIRVEGVPPPQADLIRQGAQLIVKGAVGPESWPGV